MALLVSPALLPQLNFIGWGSPNCGAGPWILRCPPKGATVTQDKDAPGGLPHPRGAKAGPSQRVPSFWIPPFSPDIHPPLPPRPRPPNHTLRINPTPCAPWVSRFPARTVTAARARRDFPAQGNAGGSRGNVTREGRAATQPQRQESPRRAPAGLEWGPGALPGAREGELGHPLDFVPCPGWPWLPASTRCPGHRPRASGMARPRARNST